MHFHFCPDEMATIAASVPMAAAAWFWARTRTGALLRAAVRLLRRP